jgi:hypothetical protein
VPGLAAGQARAAPDPHLQAIRRAVIIRGISLDRRSMSTREIRIATRKSALALWQAEYVKARLEQAHPVCW